jgi:RNA polymerase sigma factor (sigma-70 family)
MGETIPLISAKDNRLINNIAWDVYKTYAGGLKHLLDIDDLIHFGIIGLLEANKRLDSKQTEARQYTFKSFRVRGEMLDFLRKEGFDGIIRLPQHKMDKIKALKSCIKQFKNGQAAEPTPEELARELAWPLDEVYQVAAMTPKISRIYGKDNKSAGPFEPPANAPNQEDIIYRRQVAKIIQKCIEGLSIASRIIWQRRFGEDKITLRELAENFERSIQYIHQCSVRANEQMASCLKNNGIEEV